MRITVIVHHTKGEAGSSAHAPPVLGKKMGNTVVCETFSFFLTKY